MELGGFRQYIGAMFADGKPRGIVNSVYVEGNAIGFFVFETFKIQSFPVIIGAGAILNFQQID